MNQKKEAIMEIQTTKLPGTLKQREKEEKKYLEMSQICKELLQI